MTEQKEHRNKFGEFIQYILGFPRSIYINFRCLPFKQACHLPILVSIHTKSKSLRGHITINSPLKIGLIKIGLGKSQLVDFRRERTILNIQGNLTFYGKCKIGSGSRIFVASTGHLTFHDNFHNSSQLSIICFKSITFGQNNGQSWHNLIMDSDQHRIYDAEGKRINEDAPIVFGNNVWCGCNCTFLKGTFIGNDVVVGANSCVSGKHIENNVILAGNPAHVVRHNITWN